LSGAGPSVLIFLDPRAALQKTRRNVIDHLARHRLAAELIPTSIHLRGAQSSLSKS
jgi:homoserine kinase